MSRTQLARLQRLERHIARHAPRVKPPSSFDWDAFDRVRTELLGPEYVQREADAWATIPHTDNLMHDLCAFADAMNAQTPPVSDR